MLQRTLLFTDLVDSTQLVESLGDVRAAALWTEHDTFARDLLSAHHGREIDHTDGFLLLFDDPACAARYVLAYHQFLANRSLSARAGLHVGAVSLRDNTKKDIDRGAKNTEVEGLAKPYAARIMGLARPNQTLMSAAAVAALGAALPPGSELANHGHYRLKGVETPAEIFELGVRGSLSPFLPPADAEKGYRVARVDDLWRPVREIRNNLPSERDSFIGRTEDLRSVAVRLEAGVRLLTIVGSAGTGKTRLVRRYGWSWLGDWPGGIYFCDLSETQSRDGIFFAVASALELNLGKDDPAVQIGHAIAGRGRCLVILDNFEQLVEHAPDTVGRWLDRSVLATFLVTSRERVHILGEEILPIEPLSLNKEAIDLFTARASAQNPRFQLTEGNRPAVAEVVRLLDGLPLAIELAAARVRVLSPAQMVERMRDRFALLAGPRGAASRQATLRAAIDWSWDLLLDWEKEALAQCSVFEGGFTVDAAEAVLTLAAWTGAPAAVDVIQALVDKSLLRAWSTGDSGRYDGDERYFGMYLSIHDYASFRLKSSGSRTEQGAIKRHGRYFAGLGSDQALEALFRSGGVLRRRALTLAIDNLVAACRRAVARLDGEQAVGAYRAAWEALEMRGPFSLGVTLGLEVMRLGSIPSSSRSAACVTLAMASRLVGHIDEAKRWLDEAHDCCLETSDRRGEGIVLSNLGTLHREQGRMEEAHGLLEAALAVHIEVGNRPAEGTAHSDLGGLHFEQGRTDEGLKHLEAALSIHRDLGNRRDEGIVLGNLAILYFDQCRLEDALSHYEACCAIAREIGDRRVEGMVLGNLSIVHHELGHWEEALTHYEASLAIHRELGNRRFEGGVLGNLGNLHLEQGRVQTARDHYEAALAINRELGDRRQEGLVLINLGNLKRGQGEIEEALKLYEDALRMHHALGNQRDEGSVLGILGDVFAELGRISEAQKALASGETLLRGIGNRLELAKLLCVKGTLQAIEGAEEGARAALAEAKGVAQALGTDPDSDLGRKIVALENSLDSRFVS
jgi:predicted ATPase/class 3 adenylate cyclase/uncharacterized protein HemY